MACRRFIISNTLNQLMPKSGVLYRYVVPQRFCCLQINIGHAYCKRQIPNRSISTVIPYRSATTSSVAVDVVASLSDFTVVAERINTQLASRDTGRLFAVVHISGKQRLVTVEDVVIVDKPVEADIGQRIRLNKVLLVGGCDFTVVGRPVLSPSVAVVEATVIEKTLSHTDICFWYHRRENYKVFRLHRSCFTFLRINSIDLASVDDSAT